MILYQKDWQIWKEKDHHYSFIADKLDKQDKESLMIWWEQKEKVVAKEQFLPPLNVSQYWSGKLALGSKPGFAMLDRSFVSTLSFHTTRALLQNKNINMGVI